MSTKNKTYTAWVNMKQRCLNPNNTHYEYYGGRGITVCAEWLTFDNFFKDMGDKPEGLTLDRIDVYGNYEPGNCRWVSMKVQADNRRPTGKLSNTGHKYIYHNGKTTFAVSLRGCEYIGTFKSIDQAIKARDEAIK